MKIPQWFLSVWEACPLKILRKLNVSPGNSDLKPIPHNLGLIPWGSRLTDECQPARSPHSGYLHSPTLQVFFFLTLVLQLPPFTQTPSLENLVWVLAHHPHPHWRPGGLWTLDLNQKWQKWELSFSGYLLWTGSVLSALHATPPTQHCGEISEVTCVHTPLRGSKRQGLDLRDTGEEMMDPHLWVSVQEPQKHGLRMPHCVSLGSLGMGMALDQVPRFPIHPLDSTGVGRGAAFHLLPEKSHLSASLLWGHYHALLWLLPLLCFFQTGNNTDSGGLPVR